MLIRPRLFFVLVIMAIWVAACAPLTPSPGKKPTGYKTNTPYKGSAPEAIVTLSLMLPFQGLAEADHLRDQIDQFQQEHPDIVVNLAFVPPDDYASMLITQIAAGNPPQITSMSFHKTVLQHLQLLDIEESGFPFGDFITEAVSGTRIAGHVVGVPWQRVECLPVYYNLVVIKGDDMPIPQIRTLLEFLTDFTRQQENISMSWYPTRYDVNKILDPPCEVDVPVFYPNPEQLGTIDKDMEQGVPEIEKQFDVTVLDGLATGYFEGDNFIASLAPVKYQIYSMRLEPVTLISYTNFELSLVAATPTPVPTLIPGQYYPVGVLLIPQGSTSSYSPGNYLVACHTAPPDPATCRLTTPNGNGYETSAEVTRLRVSVDPPQAQVQPQLLRFCWSVDRIRFCIGW